MEISPERMNMWVPAPGTIVRMKRGFDNSREASALARAGVDELKEGKLYEVLEYIQNPEQRALRLQEVEITYIGGKQHKKVTRIIPFTPKLDFFEPAREHYDT